MTYKAGIWNTSKDIRSLLPGEDLVSSVSQKIILLDYSFFFLY